MKTIYRQINFSFSFSKLATLFIVCIAFSFSQAQNMFFHLLPGFGTPFTWVGLGANSNWNTPQNWSTSIVPGLSDTAIFDDSCIGAACNATINTAISIGGMKIKNTYSGTITQSNSQTIDIGTGGWTQAAGTFTGSDAAITMNGDFAFTGGTFTSTSTLLTFSSVNYSVSGAAAFQANNGKVLFSRNGGQTLAFSTEHYKDVEFKPTGWATISLSNTTLNVDGDLTLAAYAGCGGSCMLSTGTINSKGHVYVVNDGMEGSTNLRLVGNANQTIDASTSGPTNLFPALEIASTAGTVSILGSFRTNQNFTYTSGTVDAGTSHIKFLGSSQSIIPGSISFYDVTIGSSQWSTKNLNAGTMTVSRDLTLDAYAGCASSCAVNNGTISVNRNITLVNDGMTGTAIIAIVGTGAQSLTGGAGAYLPSVDINKPSGTLSLSNSFLVSNNWTYTAGTVNAGTSTLGFSKNSGTCIFTPGPVNYYNVQFGGHGTSVDLNSGTAVVTNTLTFDDDGGSAWNGLINNGTINASGNVTFLNDGKRGNAILNLTGATNTTLSIAAAAATLTTTHNVAKTGGARVSLTANVSYSSAGRNLSISSGVLNVAGFALSVNNLLTISSGGTLICNGGTATAGSWTINGEISCGIGQGITWTGLAGDNLWSTAGNWTNNTIPVATDKALFSNAICVGANCNAQIDSSVSVRGINLKSTYTGTLTQNAARTLTVGADGFVQAAGTFAGGNSSITISGQFLVTGGTFTATSGNLSAGANVDFRGSTFNHNSGTFLTNGNQAPQNLWVNAVSFNNFTLGGVGNHQYFNSSSFNVLGNLVVDNAWSGVRIYDATINLSGNLNVGALGYAGNYMVRLVGSSNQTITQTGAGAYGPGLEIASTGGTVTFATNYTNTYNFLYTSGVVDFGSTTLKFDGDYNYPRSITPGALNFNNVIIGGTGMTTTLTGTMLVNGNLTLDEAWSSVALNGGTVEVKGNVNATQNGKVGTTTIKLTGNSNQTITSTAGAYLPRLEIASTGGTVTFSGTISLNSNFTYTSGTVDAATSTFNFWNTWANNATISTGGINFNNVALGQSGTNHDFNGSSLNVLGSLTIYDGWSGPGSINNGTINAYGNVSFTGYGHYGSALLNLVGNATSDLSMVSTSYVLSSNPLNIAKTGGASVRLTSDFNLFSAGKDLSITSGTLDLNSYDLAVNDVLTVGAGTTLKCNGGDFTAGTLTNGGTVNCPGFSTYDFNWTGSGGDANWSTAGNWQGGVAPGASDVVAFQDSTCGVNCNSTISASTSVRGVRIYSPSTGTITQSGSNTLTIGAKSWTQLAGTFVGGSGDITVNLPAISGKFSQTGGTFTSTSGNLKIARANHLQANLTQIAFEIGAGATFNHNNGTLFMNCNETWGGSSKYGMDVNNSLTLYNLKMKADGGGSNGHYVASGDTITVLNDFEIQSGVYLTGGTIALQGNFIDATSGYAGTRGNLKMVGSANQTYTYSGTREGPKLEIDKSGGSVTAGSANVKLSKLVVTNGTFTAPTGNLIIGVSAYLETGSQTLMSLASPASFVDSGGKLTLYGFDDWSASYTYTWNFNGALNVTDAEVIGYASSNNTIAGGSTLVVNGTLTHTSGVLNGAIQAKGNTVFNSANKGSATITFNGTGAQSISGTNPTAGNWTVNKASGTLTMANALNLNGGGQNLTITAGTMNMSGNNLTVAGNISNSGTLQRGNNPTCGTLTYGGSYTGSAAICP